MMKPDLKTFKLLAQKSSLLPTYEELAADMDTPVGVYLKLSHSNSYAALLESVEGNEKVGRYSFISISHHMKFEYSKNRLLITRLSSSPLLDSLKGQRQESIECGDPLDELRKIFFRLKPVSLPELPRFCGGAVGMMSYDVVRNFEKLPSQLKDDLAVPEALFLFTDECVVFDHWKHKIILIKWNLIEQKNDSCLSKIYRRSENALKNLRSRIQGRSQPFFTAQKERKVAVPSGTVPFLKRDKEWDVPDIGSKGFTELKGAGGKGAIRSNCPPDEFQRQVNKIKKYILAGDVIQTVFSQRFEIESKLNPFQIYRALRMINPSPYLYFLKMNGFSIGGSSPEILVKKEGEVAITRPIAGTRPRGKTEIEDQELEKELLRDPKEKAEHLMLVDLGRNDLGRCCSPGSIRVPEFMTVERYSHVMHLVSTVVGSLKKGEDSFSLFKACFPAGTVTGAPKIRAMEIIEEVEKVRRGIYAGSVGYFSYSGNMDMAITIRTFLFKNNRCYMQAGAGIVADSLPMREERETRSKAAALFSALNLAKVLT